MKHLHRILLSSVVFAAPAALAQTTGSITFSPASAATAVPTLGGAFLLMLAALLGVIALKAVQRRQQRGTIASLLTGALLTGSLVSAMTGAMLMQEAQAGSGQSILNPESQTFDINCNFNQFNNQAGVAMTVTALTPPTGCPSETNSSVSPQACTVGLTLENGESCSLNYDGGVG